MGIGIYCQQGAGFFSQFCHVTIGQRMSFAAGEFQENVIGHRNLCLFSTDKARMRQDINPRLDCGQVSARHHRFNRSFPMSDNDFCPEVPCLGNQIGEAAQAEVISDKEAATLKSYHEKLTDLLAVDDFAPDEIGRGTVRPEPEAKPARKAAKRKQAPRKKVARKKSSKKKASA